MAFSITPATTSVNENAGSVTFTVSRSPATTTETVYFSTILNGGSNTNDYTPIVDRQLTFAPGVSSQQVTVSITPDSEIEPNQTFGVIIQQTPNPNPNVFLDRSFFTIVNDDAAQNTTYSLTPSSTSVTEGGQVTFTVTRSGDKPAEIVYFSTLADGTATYGEGDYTTTSGGQPANIAVNFSSGETSETVTLNIVNDGVSDSGEQFRAIVQRDDDDPVSTFLDRSSFVTINDAVQNTTYSLTPSSTSVTEGGQVTFTITRSGDRPAETIYFSTLADGTATWAEGDYTTTSGGQPANIAVNFSSGETSETVTLNIVSDGVSDSGEQFRAIVQRDDGDPISTFLDRSSFVTINDAVQNTNYSLTPSSTSVTEGNEVTFTITRSGDTPAERVFFSAWQDSASHAEGDYQMSNGSEPLDIAVDFAVGITSQTVTMSILDDGEADSGERFRAIVQDDPPSSDPAINLAQTDFVTINDATQNTTYSLTPSTISVTEGNQVTFTITRSGDTPAERVFFSAWQDSASYAEGDYEMSNGSEPLDITVDFAVGVTSQTVTMSILNDGQSDSGERFRAVVQRDPPSSDPAINLSQTNFITINDVGANTTYSLVPSTTSVSEGNQITFTITRSGEKPAETVYFSTLADGSATFAEGDYATTGGGMPLNIAVEFSSGETSRAVTLNVINDGVSDSGEQFRAIVQRNSSDPVSTYLDRSVFTTVFETAPTSAYSLTPSVSDVTEGSQVIFTINRSGATPAETVYFSTLADGTATSAEGDYAMTLGGSPLNIPVSFGTGVTSQTVALDILDDGMSDSSEQFRAIVQRSSSDSVASYLDQSPSVTIHDISHSADPANPGWLNGAIEYLTSFVNVPHAAANTTAHFAGLSCYPSLDHGAGRFQGY